MTTALIIEDNENNMVLICKILQYAGYHTIQAITGKQGVDVAIAQQPDFILLDIQLPDIDGTEVLTLLKQSESGQSIPVIAMTSYAMAGDREKLLAAGCDGYIEKPIDPTQVIAQIEQVVKS